VYVKPPTILVIDDDPAFRTMVARQLELTGYDVVEAADGPAGLDRLAAGGIDLVLLDVMMPGLDGRQVCQQIRAQPSDLYIPIIMLTGLGGDAARQVGFSAGADDYLPKPYQVTELRDRVAVWLCAHDGRRLARPPAAAPVLSPGDAWESRGRGAAALDDALRRQIGREHALVLEAQRLPLCLAAVLIPYAQAQGWDESQLAQELGCPSATLARLLLRRRPGPLTWDADIAVAAEACGADAHALDRVLRAATSRERGAPY
jgi:DNA-binding response OmpR family regulator